MVQRIFRYLELFRRGTDRQMNGKCCSKCLASLQGERKKVAPLQLLLIFQQCVQIFAWNFTQLLLNHIFTLSLSLVEIYWKMTKLCYFNQYNPPISRHFERCLSLVIGWWPWKEPVCWWWNEICMHWWNINQSCRWVGLLFYVYLYIAPP